MCSSIIYIFLFQRLDICYINPGMQMREIFVQLYSRSSFLDYESEGKGVLCMSLQWSRQLSKETISKPIINKQSSFKVTALSITHWSILSVYTLKLYVTINLMDWKLASNPIHRLIPHTHPKSSFFLGNTIRPRPSHTKVSWYKMWSAMVWDHKSECATKYLKYYLKNYLICNGKS